MSWDDDERWLVVHRGDLRVVANLSGEHRDVELDRAPAGALFSTAEHVALGQLSVACRPRAPRW